MHKLPSMLPPGDAPKQHQSNAQTFPISLPPAVVLPSTQGPKPGPRYHPNSPSSPNPHLPLTHHRLQLSVSQSHHFRCPCWGGGPTSPPQCQPPIVLSVLSFLPSDSTAPARTLAGSVTSGPPHASGCTKVTNCGKREHFDNRYSPLWLGCALVLRKHFS